VKSRRILSLAAAAVVGLATTLLLASPASAHDTDVTPEVTCDISTGVATVTWKITTTNEPGKHFGFREVEFGPASGTVTGLASEVGFPHANGAIITATQVLPAGFDGYATIAYGAEWDDDAKASAEDKISLKGECVQGYTVTEDCNGITFTFTPPDFRVDTETPHTIDVTLTPSVGDPKTITLVEGGPDQTVSFAGSTGLTVTVTIGEEFKNTHAWTHAPCPLPLTGSSLTGPAVIGGSLLLVGAALIAGLFMFRRRRTVASS
jgi:hypothetical protein